MAAIPTWGDHSMCRCYSLMLSIFLCSHKASDYSYLLAHILKNLGYHTGTKLSQAQRKAHLSYSVTRNPHLSKQSQERTGLQKCYSCLHWGFKSEENKTTNLAVHMRSLLLHKLRKNTFFAIFASRTLTVN